MLNGSLLDNFPFKAALGSSIIFAAATKSLMFLLYCCFCSSASQNGRDFWSMKPRAASLSNAWSFWSVKSSSSTGNRSYSSTAGCMGITGCPWIVPRELMGLAQAVAPSAMIDL